MRGRKGSGLAAVLAVVVSSGVAHADGSGRRSVFDTGPSVPTPAAPGRPAASGAAPFTLGTLFSAALALQSRTTYKVRDGVVIVDLPGDDVSSRLSPSVLAMPSVTVLGGAGHSLSLLVPVGLTAGSVSTGFGLAWGIAVTSSAEVGLAVAVLWTPAQRLTATQQASLQAGTRLPASESDAIGTILLPALALGIYLAPLF